jgi:ligand-binding SRPBCC domain-containing protein
MMIEESVLINAGMDQVWRSFTDLTCWDAWSRTARKVSPESCTMEQGTRFRFRLRPFVVPVDIMPVIDEIVPHERVVWSGSKYGISSRHEFLFQQAGNGVLVTSREKLIGLPLVLGGRRFTERTVRNLTVRMLRELKAACEQDPVQPS